MIIMKFAAWILQVVLSVVREGIILYFVCVIIMDS
jgi:phage shock protein PspC (stress-responsive transcriptional regulator)